MSEKGKDKEKLERFGRYLLLDHLVNGGMAKICRARYLGEQADKIVAIKMIKPQFSEDESFKKMFMDEIKVTFGLIHPNIAQTYDYGILNGQLYTAMEYVDGKNIKQFLDKLKEMKYVFPVEISIYITTQICQALSYAHNFTDKLTGKILNIIHRDISPHNVMINYDGSVKVIDFGIAKASTNSEETVAGTIKGKLSYLAPEYLEGLDLDHRYDQFAVGITLWELLCGRKLFQAKNELATLKKIQKCDIPPPSSINPNVPKEFDEVLLKSVKKDRSLRYDNMEQFNRALVRFLYEKYPNFNAQDLKYFASELFKKDIEDDRKKLLEFGKIDIAPYLKDLKDSEEGKSSKRPAPSFSSGEDGEREVKRPIIELELEDDDDDDQSTSKGNLIGEKTNSKLTKSGVTLRAKDRSQTRIQSYKKSPESTKSGSQTRSFSKEDLERETKKGKSNTLPLVIFAVIAGLIYVKLPLVRKIIKNPKNALAIIKGSPLKQKTNPLPTEGDGEVGQQTTKVLLNNTNLYQSFFLNNKEISYPIDGLDLERGKTYSLRVEQEGMDFVFTHFDTTGKKVVQVDIPQAQEAVFGILNSSKDFFQGSTLRFSINGNEIIYTLPIINKKIPVGVYNGIIYNAETETEKDFTFEVKESAITKILP